MTMTTRLRALFGVMALFGGLFVLPLCVALSLCTMPCCHHGESDSAVVSADMNCATECAVQSDDATETTVATMPGVHRAAPVVVTVLFPLDAAPDIGPRARDAGAPHRVADAPLHVLNSVFRI